MNIKDVAKRNKARVVVFQRFPSQEIRPHMDGNLPPVMLFSIMRLVETFALIDKKWNLKWHTYVFILFKTRTAASKYTATGRAIQAIERRLTLFHIDDKAIRCCRGIPRKGLPCGRQN